MKHFSLSLLVFEIFDWITSDGPPCINEQNQIPNKIKNVIKNNVQNRDKNKIKKTNKNKIIKRNKKEKFYSRYSSRIKVSKPS